MPKDRYFLDQDLKKNSLIELLDKEAHHIRTLRKKENDIVEVVNGKGYLAFSKIEKINKKSIQLIVEDVFFEKEKKTKLILVLAFLKPHKLDFLVEKATEIGVDEIWLFKSKNSEKINFSKNKLNRMKNILIAAIKQSGRLYLPIIKIFDSIKNIKKLSGNIYFGDLKKEAKNFKDVYKKNKKNIFFFIGPEMGFSKEEFLYLENKLSALGVKLNNNILKAETAAIVASSITAHLQLL